jgi:glycosyltransferase involved in cell wall biosynthesis
MNILVNFSTLKTGGGQNVAMNFLHSFVVMDIKDIKFFFFVAKDSEPHLFLKKINYPHYHVVPRNPIKRILFELFCSSTYLSKNFIDIIYSYFGVGIFDRKIPQVSGSADSNLYFPEINFWSDFSGLARLKKWVVDTYRVWGVKRSSAVVFENKALEARAIKLFNLKNTDVIKPSINFDLETNEYHLPSKIKKDVPKGLFLCGWHPNKNYNLIPAIAAILKRNGIPFHFIITAPLDNSSRHKKFQELVSENNVDDMVSIVGHVKKDELQSLYEQIDYVFLLSKLESFSNNIIEAWYFKKPLIIAEGEWSRSICGEAALYVGRDSAFDIFEKIKLLQFDHKLKSVILSKGTEKLQEYPTIEERIFQEMEFLRNVFKNI